MKAISRWAWIVGLLMLLIAMCSQPAFAVTSENFCRTFYSWNYINWIDELNPTTVHRADSCEYFQQKQGGGETLARASICLIGPYPEDIYTGETVDSVMIVGFGTRPGSGGAKSSDTTNVYILNVANRQQQFDPYSASWNKYSSVANWQTAGAWGANDLDLSFNLGWGAGIVYQFMAPCPDFGDSLYLARGTAFTNFVKGRLVSDTVYGANYWWIWHDDHQVGNPGTWTVMGFRADYMSPVMRVYGHRSVSLRGPAPRGNSLNGVPTVIHRSAPGIRP